MHTISEVNIAWNINDDTSHTHRVEIPNSLYITNKCERLISIQHWAQKETPTNAYVTTLYGTRYVTHHDCTALIWGDGKSIQTVPLDKKNIFTLQTAPGYTAFTAYCSAIGYDQYLHDDKPDCIPDNLAFSSRPAVTHITIPSTPHTY